MILTHNDPKVTPPKKNNQLGKNRHCLGDNGLNLWDMDVWIPLWDLSLWKLNVALACGISRMEPHNSMVYVFFFALGALGYPNVAMDNSFFFQVKTPIYTDSPASWQMDS